MEKEEIEKRSEKTAKEKAVISVEIVNLLSAKKCTINEADEILKNARWTIEHTSMVQSFKWEANSSNEKV